MVCNLCIHRFSSQSMSSFASLLSGGAGSNIYYHALSEGDSGGHLLKCLATVVSLSWEISNICP